jgi:hypothetical protein
MHHRPSTNLNVSRWSAISGATVATRESNVDKVAKPALPPYSWLALKQFDEKLMNEPNPWTWNPSAGLAVFAIRWKSRPTTTATRNPHAR